MFQELQIRYEFGLDQITGVATHLQKNTVMARLWAYMVYRSSVRLLCPTCFVTSGGTITTEFSWRGQTPSASDHENHCHRETTRYLLHQLVAHGISHPTGKYGRDWLNVE